MGTQLLGQEGETRIAASEPAHQHSQRWLHALLQCLLAAPLLVLVAAAACQRGDQHLHELDLHGGHAVGAGKVRSQRLQPCTACAASYAMPRHNRIPTC